MQQNNESDFHVYSGNKFPRFLRFTWTVLIVFSIYYLVKYMWPDLALWWTKVK